MRLGHIKLTAVIVMLSVYCLGIANLKADTISHPVSVAVPDQINGDLFTNPVSVAFPSTMYGSFYSSPVSVSVPTPVDGQFYSKAVSVAIPVPTDGSFMAKPASAIFQPANLGDPDLVGLWHMDGDWGDSSGNKNHGIPINSVNFSNEAKKGSQSANFDGINAYLRVPLNASIDITKNITIEAWIKPTNVNKEYQIILSKNYQYVMGLYSTTGRLYFEFNNISGNYINVISNQSLQNNNWYHITSTYDGFSLKIYINGKLDNEVLYSGIIQSQNYDLLIGDQANNCSSAPGCVAYDNYYFQGLMDEVAIYKRALTAEEIAKHYADGVNDPAAPAPPVLNPVPSVVGTSTINLSGTKPANTSVWVNNKKTAAFSNISSWQGNYGALQPGANILNVTALDASNRESQPVTKTIFYDNIPPIIESSYPANNSNTAKVVTSVTINLYDANSAIDLTGSIQTATVKNAAGQTIAGTWTTSGTKTIVFTPAIAFPPDTYTVTIYPVDAVGNKGQQQIIFTNHDTSAPVSKASLSGTRGNDGWFSTPVTVTLTADDGAEGSGVAKVEYSLDAGATWQLYAAPFVMDRDGKYTLQFRATDKVGNVETPAKSQDIKINKTGLVGLWHMDNNWLDSSLMANDVTPYNGAIFSPDAKIGTNSAGFNGSNTYLRRASGNSLPLGNSPRTYMAWIKPFSYPDGGYNGILAYGPMACGNASLLSIKNDGRLSMAFWCNDAYQTVGPPATLNQWNHVAFTYESGTTVKFYMNGQFVQESPLSAGTPANTQDGPLRIGSTDDPGRVFNGLIDEVAIYNRALSPTEILEQYRNYSIGVPTVEPIVSPTNIPNITLRGTKPANTAIVVNGTTVVPLDAAITWQGAYTLKSGMNNLTITGMDADGFHSQPATLSIALDDTPPAVESTVPVNAGAFNSTISVLTFNLRDAFSTVDLTATVAGATVTKLGNAVTGTWATSGSGSTGTVTFTPSSILSEGTYTAVIYPTDSFGNGRNVPYTLTFTVDMTPPPAPTIDAIPLPINTIAKTITGTKTTDSVRVAVSCGGAAVGAVTYPSATTWSVNISGLQEGTNTVSAYAADAAGNQSVAAGMSFVVDTIPPLKPAINTPVSPTRNSTVTLTGAKEANSWLFVNNLRTAVPFADTSWSYAVSLTEGNNSFAVFAQDLAGNQGQTAAVAVVRDTTPPVIAASTPAFNALTNNAGSVTITLADTYAGADLQASLAGAVVKNSSGNVVSGSWSVAGSAIAFTPAVPLPDGIYSITIYPVDTLGNKGSATFSFTLDRAPPTVQSLVMNPTSPVKAGAVSFTLTFNKAMDMNVPPVVTVTRPGFIFDTTYTLTGSWQNAATWRGSYTFTTASGDAAYTVKAGAAKDLASNSMADQQAGSFILDTIPPAAPTIGQVASLTKAANQTLTGTKEANSAIIINNLQRVPLNADTTWSYSYPLAEGANSLTITARDAAGNDSQPISPAPVVTLDTTPPIFTIDTYKNPSPTVTQTIAGKKEPGSIVTIKNGAIATTIFDATDQNAAWSYPITLTDGITNHLVFTAADSLGNTTTKTLDILSDTVPPQSLAIGMLMADGSGKGTEVTLSWPSYVEPAGMAYYRVYYATADFTSVAALTPVGTVNRGTRIFKVTGLIQGTNYFFAVVPVSASGNADPTVHTAQAVPTDTLPPEDVTGLSAWAGYTATDGNYATLSWTGSVNSMGDLADQIVYMDDGKGYGAGTPLGKTATTFTKKGLADATPYKFKVTVKDTLGHESAGSVVTAVTRLANPTGLAATPGNGKAALTWNAMASPYVKFYNIYRLASATPQTDVSGMTLIKSQTGTNFIDTGLTNGAIYQYALTTVNSSGAERTSVQSIAASPRGDTTGPVISGLNLIANQVITAPITITATAQDAESAMGRMEIWIDNVLVQTQNGGSVSYIWNVVNSTDGNHMVKIAAYDSLGNLTEQTVPVVVSLAPPVVPVITTTFSGPINQKTVAITGTAMLYSTVTLRVNGVVVGAPQTVSAAGTFTFSGVTLSEGDNFIAAKAANRGGESPYSADRKITVVTVAPAAPIGLAAKAIAGGSLQFTWQAGATGAPVGYNLYAGSAPFTAVTNAGVSKINSAPIPYLLKESIPADDAPRSYAVTAIDGAGNESPASNVVTIASDRLAPMASAVSFTDAAGALPAGNVFGPGTVQLALTVSEPLSEAPFFSLEPQNASPIVVSLRKVDDTHYAGGFTIDATYPHGPTVWKFSGKDMVGNRGNGSGAGITIDVKGPAATVTAPLTLLKTTAGPAQVVFSFDEPSTTVPSLTLKASDGSTAQVTALATTDNGLHWSGTLDPSALSEGTGRFLLAGAKDRFGNTGTTVKSGGSILLYKNAPPAPAVPTGLAAKSAKGGSITLSWTKVADSQGYGIYRKGAGDAAPVLIMTIAAGATVTYADTPPTDGTYLYSISAIGFLNVESAQSSQVSAISDRTPPPVPTGLSLAMTGNGVQAAWDKVAAPAEVPAAFRLYRSSGPIPDLSGLTPVATVATAAASDPAPTSSGRFYAVTALDSLGNESAPSTTQEITFPVAPVRNLILTRVDDGKPSLSWESGESGLLGFYIYRNGSKINQTPTVSTSFSDGYYAGGSVKYGISAVNSLGNESPIKEVTLPIFTLGLKDGTVLRRGMLENVALVASLPPDATAALTIDSVSLKIGNLPESAENGPFTAATGTPLEIKKVAATEATAPSQVAVVITAVMNPAPGAAVRITRSSVASVLGAGTALEIFNDPLIRGAQGKVRIKVNNLGSAQMSFLTSENGGATSQVKIYLKDQDGNVLAQGNLNQQTGAVVNSGGYATARIEPGGSFLSDPITFVIPSTAPYRVVLAAEIANTWYHYNQPDQVVAPGLKQAVDTTIADVSYTALAATDKGVYKQGESVKVTGQATSTATGAPMPLVPVKIGISTRGFDRFFTVNTDQAGAFGYTFTPASNEAGSYSVWATHPDLSDRTVQAQFSIIGLSVAPTLANITILKGGSFDIPVTLANLGGSPLTGLAFTPSASSGITASVVNPGAAALAAGENRTVTFRIATDAAASSSGYASLAIATTEGLSDKVDANVTLVTAIPVITTAPSYIDTGIVRGTQRIESFTLTNTGYGTLTNATIEGPSLPWLSLTIDKALGDIASGQSRTIGILIKPADIIPQGVYNDRIVINSPSHIPYIFNIQVTVTSSAVGGVQFSVLDELMKKVGGASITLQNQSIPALLYNLTTAADGAVSIFDIPEGRYSYNISASGHKPYSGSFVIVPGITTVVPVALEVTLVTVEWSVTPVVIQDRYPITISQTFETNVPTPVIVTEPPGITIPDIQPGQVFNGEFSITNYGLIAADYQGMNFPASFDDYDLEILANIPARLSAMQKVVVPYRITRRQVLAQASGTGTTALIARDNLFAEVEGFGGGSCARAASGTTSWSYTICPNTANERRASNSSSFSFTYYVPGCGGVASAGVGGIPTATYVGGWGGGGYGGSGQGGGGGMPGGSVTPIASEQCFAPKCILKRLMGETREINVKGVQTSGFGGGLPSGDGQQCPTR